MDGEPAQVHFTKYLLQVAPGVRYLVQVMTATTMEPLLIGMVKHQDQVLSAAMGIGPCTTKYLKSTPRTQDGHKSEVTQTPEILLA